jgi:hypothetical protein
LQVFGGIELFKGCSWFSFLLAVAISLFGEGVPIDGFEKKAPLSRI